jgi:putative DNA primase/helicase
MDPITADRLRKAEGGVMTAFVSIKERARGQWHTILPALGVDRRFLNRKNGPCPMCGGKDRWRFTDMEGKGTWWCNRCKGGAGIALALKFTGLPFKEAAREIERIIGTASVAPISIKRPDQQKNRAALNQLWRNGTVVRPNDPVDRWLQNRGVGPQEYPTSLRFGPSVRHSGPPATWWPAMIAMVSDANGKPATLHKTSITADGTKAPVEKVRMFCPGKRPCGGAVRLTPIAPILGVAEGIETALAASKLFGTPTWAALDATGVEKFDPPAGVDRLVIFGDQDVHGIGQRAAYTLASRLSGRIEIDVKIPDEPGTDWNDIVMQGAR